MDKPGLYKKLDYLDHGLTLIAAGVLLLLYMNLDWRIVDLLPWLLILLAVKMGIYGYQLKLVKDGKNNNRRDE